MSALHIQPVVDELSAARWHAVDAATRPADVPADPVGEVLPMVRMSAATGERVERWVGLLDGEPVANGQLTLPLHDNLDNATIDVRVEPSRRRTGHGRTMLAHVLGGARAEGRRRVYAEIDEPFDLDTNYPPGRSFAESLGARPVLTEVRRRLDLDDADEEKVQRLEDEAREFADGYDLVQWLDHTPEPYVHDMAMLMARMSTDVPLGDMQWKEEKYDVSRVRANEEAAVARGRLRIVTAARQLATDRLVGYTEIGVNTSAPTIGYQWDTIVQREHRGHRLGLLMKAANLAFLRRSIDGVQILNTWNAEVNVHMIAVNEALGFRAMDRCLEWELDLVTR